MTTALKRTGAALLTLLMFCMLTLGASAAANTPVGVKFWKENSDKESMANSGIDSDREATLARQSNGTYTLMLPVKLVTKLNVTGCLTGLTIGVQLGTTGDLSVTDEYGDDAVERYNKGFEAVQALVQGKIDAVVIDELPAEEFVKSVEGLKILESAYSQEDYAICFKKDNTDLCDKVNEAIKELKDEGTFDQIANSYIGDSAGENYYESPEDVDRSNGTLVMATNAEFEPYEYHEGDDIVGIDADIAQAICDKLGYELKIEDMEFDSILPAVQSGKADFGAAGMTVTEDRKSSVDFTDTYADASQVIIVKK